MKDNHFKNKYILIMERKKNMKKKILSFFLAAAMLLPMTAITASAATETENYAWYTGGKTAAPINASRYFIPDTANLYDDTKKFGNVTAVEGGWTTTVLNDGSYAQNKDILMAARTTTSSNMTFDPSQDYIVIEFDKKYELSKLMIGASYLPANNGYFWNNSLRNIKISYYDDASGQWVWAEDGKQLSTGRISKDGRESVDNKFYSEIVFSKTYTTTKLRVEFAEASRTTLSFTGITELIPYGTIPLKETYAWGTATAENAAPIKAEYTLGSALTRYTDRWTTSANANFDDGDYTTNVLLQPKLTSAAVKTENGYIQMDFDKPYIIDNLLVGINSDNYVDSSDNAIRIKRFCIDYYDVGTGRWIEDETAGRFDANWNYADETGNIYKKRAYTANIANTLKKTVTTNSIRFYPTSAYTGANFFGLHELVAYGRVAEDVPVAVFNYKDANGNEVSDFSAEAKNVIPEITISNPTKDYSKASLIIGFYNESEEFVEAAVAAFDENSKAVFNEPLIIPASATELKTFIWELENVKPLFDVVSVKR